MSLTPLDFIIVGLYLALIASIGLYAARGQNTSAKYFLAERSIPGWAVAFTLMATMISTGTFIGHPGTAYDKGLILLLPHLLLPLVLLIVARVVVPFYRQAVRMSAYEYIAQRFGTGGRIYTSLGFVADRIFDLGVTLLTTAIAVYGLTGWDLRAVLLGVGLFTIVYTMIGGLAAVVWTDVVQGILILAGALFILLRVLLAPEAGAPFAVLGEAYRSGKLTFGSTEFTWASLFDAQTTTLWIFLLVYAVNWLRRYTCDQNLVQRYLVARTDAEATRAAKVGASLCVPVWAMFMLAGACLPAFFKLTGLEGPAVSDAAMPYFMAHFLPSGLLGLILAAILAAAMSTVSADLNSVATVVTADYFVPAFPQTSDRARLRCGRLMVLVGGLLAAGIGMLLVPSAGEAPLMERALTITTILSGGTLGLFSLGFLTRTATRQGCYVGIACCVLFTAWALLTGPRNRVWDAGFNFTMNPIFIGLFGHAVLFGTGWLASRLLGGYRPEHVDRLTLWGRSRTESTES